MYCTSDQGKSFTCLGKSDVRNRFCDEHMVVELKNGVLMMLVRIMCGIGVAYSYDRGKTWSCGEESKLGGPCSRFFVGRLKSGRILLINHVNFTGRNNLTALLSEDDGKTFPYRLLLDERNEASYAYGCEASSLCDAKIGETLEGALDVVTGEVLDFTDELSENYTMTVSVNETYPVEELAGRYIYVNNDGHENGVYEIFGAACNEDGTVTLDMGHQDFIRGFVDEFNMDLGYLYNIAEGQTYSIPLSADFDPMEYFSYQTDTVVKAGNKLSLSLGTGAAAYEADGLVSGMKLDKNTGALTWTTSRTNVGKYPITVKALQDGKVMGEMSFTVYVVNYTGSAYAPDKCTHSKNVDFGTESVCPACGTITRKAEEVIEKFDVAGANMTLGNELKLNVMVKSSDLGEGTYTAKITHNGKQSEQIFAKYNSNYYYVTVAVTAKQMTDVITVEVFDENGNAVSNVYETSVRTYAMNVLDNKAQPAKVKTLVVDMLNYGAEAQKYFKYNAEDLANSLLTEEQKALATETVACVNKQVKGANFYGTNLSLEDRILLNLFFKNVKDGYTAKIIFTDFRGNTVTVEKELIPYSGSIYKIVVDDIVLADAFTTVTATVYDANGNVHGTVTDSVESYVARAGDNSLNVAIMKFAMAAKNYFS